MSGLAWVGDTSWYCLMHHHGFLPLMRELPSAALLLHHHDPPHFLILRFPWPQHPHDRPVQSPGGGIQGRRVPHHGVAGE